MTLTATLHWLTPEWLDAQRAARDSIMFGQWHTDGIGAP